MDYLIRFAQTHETFRRPELEVLSRFANLECEIVYYAPDSPYCVVRFRNLSGDGDEVDKVVRDFEARAILGRAIYEIWGQGRNYDELHQDVRRRTLHLWEKYKHSSFKFDFDTYGNTHTSMKQREIIDSFSYLGFKGKIKMKNPEVEFGILEEWLEEDLKSSPGSDVGVSSEPAASITLRKIFLGRKIGGSRRQLKEKHDLKKRPYISTTSMDAELALITANLALAAPGKIFLDPFVGTGGFMVAAAELGALVLGSDIDGRSFRGKGTGLRNGVGANFNKYSLQHLFGDCMTSDLTNTPFRLSLSSQEAEDHRWLDGIVADPPYGVRESLKVLGTRKATMPPKDEDGKDPGSSSVGTRPPLHLIGGVPAHTLPDYIAPKKPYSFLRMLDDILDFAARTLVDGGRIAFWMPSANENEFGQEEETLIPEHRHLELKHECIQRFNKWSRRLLVYERRSGRYVPTDANPDAQGMDSGGHTADDLNPFRKMYFQPVKDRNGIE